MGILPFGVHFCQFCDFDGVVVVLEDRLCGNGSFDLGLGVLVGVGGLSDDVSFSSLPSPLLEG